MLLIWQIQLVKLDVALSVLLIECPEFLNLHDGGQNVGARAIAQAFERAIAASVLPSRL